MENVIIDAETQKTIEYAAKITKRLEGEEVVIEIRVPAYIYSDIKDWSNIGGTAYIKYSSFADKSG